THSANYANFPGSLVITCVLDQSESLNSMLVSEQDKLLRKQIQKQLLKAGILLQDVRRHVFFDTEQACLLEHNGDWKRRLALN
ncbi:MAG: Fis family transcriptional regulator, partial [Sinobacterium sp.]